MTPRFFRPDEDHTHAGMREGFRYGVPPRFNLARACTDAHDPHSIALIAERADGSAESITFEALTDRARRMAGGLAARGVRQGDRVGVVAPQSPETGIAHLGAWTLGAVSIPLAPLFGPDALRYRLEDAGAVLVVAGTAERPKVEEAVPGVPVVEVGAEFDELLQAEPRTAADTSADDPVFIIYTSGTTGPPKGALHAHRTVFGHLPGFELLYDFAPRPGDVIWTPADWAWIGALMDVVVPAWFHGMTVVSSAADFAPQSAVDLMVRNDVTLAFLPPTALKMMRAASVDGSGLRLRAVFSGGEPLGAELTGWVEDVLGCPVNEGYGQTEANLVVGNSSRVWPVRPGSMGLPLPGHTVEVHDEDGNRLLGSVGEIVVKAPDPVMMLGYWNRLDATEEKYRGDWLLTGDLGREDEDGYLWFESRKDDVISSMGYRIGPGEIEESLLGHEAVAMCAVVGVVDEMRGQVPAAWIVVRDGVDPSEELAAELQEHVRSRLAAHEVPRRITFVDDLPRTTTGKIMRRTLREG